MMQDKTLMTLPRIWICVLMATVITEIRSLRLATPESSFEKSQSTGNKSNSNDFSFLDVTRHDDGILYLAFYLPQFHIVPENKIDGKYYTDWDFVKQNPHSFTPPTFYEMNHETLARQDDMANEYRVGGFIFYHYWNDNTMILNHPVELFMQRKRKTKFTLAWDSESGYIGTCEFDQPEKHAYQLLRYFINENYLTDKDGRKPFLMYLTSIPPDYIDRFTAFLKLYNVELKIGFFWQKYKNKWAVPASTQICAEFGPHSHPIDGDYEVKTNSCPDHWQGTLTSWDARPRACSGRSHHSCKDQPGRPSLDLWKKRLTTVKANITPNNKDRIVSIFAWNEWSEGGVLECSVEYACNFLKMLR